MNSDFKRNLFRGFQVLLFLTVVALLAAHVRQNWHRLPDLGEARIEWLVAAWLVGLPAVLCIPVSLRLLLQAQGVPVSFKQAVGLYFVPTQGKYLPGKVWSFVWAMQAYRQAGASTATAICCLVILTLLNLTSGLIASILYGIGVLNISYYWGLTVALLLLLVHPKVFGRGVTFALRLAKKEPPDRTVGGKVLAQVVLLGVLHWTVLGVGLDVLSRSILPTSSGYAVFISTQALAYVSGILAFFAPAGLGVREGVLTVLLTPVLGTGPALVLSILQRLWQVSLELPCALVGWLFMPSLKQGSTAEPFPGDG